MALIRAVLCGYYGKGNGGDEALLASLLQMLPEQVQPVVLSGNPQETYRRYGVESCDRNSAFAILKALNQAQAFIWGGGSLIQDATSALSPLYYAGLMGLAQQKRLKTIAWAQGIGPLNRALTRRFAQATFAGCDAVSVRDSASAQLLSEWKIPCELAPDPVWALAAQPVEELAHLPNPRIAVNLRQHPQLTPHRLGLLIQALIDLQAATQAFIILVPFQASEDLAIAQLIHSRMPEHSQVVSLTDPRALKGAFTGVKMAIAMRYHALISAASAQCQCFALSYDPKVTKLMAELNLPGWELAGIPEDVAQIRTAWLNHYTQAEPLPSAQVQSLIDRALIHRELLAQAFA